MEAKSIERIAEELGVNLYDLHPYILMREELARRKVVEFALNYMNDVWGYDYSGKRVDDWNAKWGVDKPK